MLRQAGMRVELDNRNEKIGYKIREGQAEKIPYMLVIGDREVESAEISVRSRKDGDIGSMQVDSFITRAENEIKNRVLQ